MIDDVLVGFEDAVRQPVFAHELPDVFDRVKFGRFGWQGQDGDVRWNCQVVGHVPSCLIHDEDRVGTVGDVSGDFDQMLVHRMSVTPRHDESRRLALPRADGAEDVGGAGSLVMWCCRP